MNVKKPLKSSNNGKTPKAIMTKSQYEKRLTETQQLHRSGNYFAAVREAGSLFELALKELLLDLARHLGSEAESLPALKSLLQDKRPTLGIYIKCIREADVQKQLRIFLKSSLPRLRRISWDGILSIRNEAVHNETSSTIDEEDSLQTTWWLQILLEDAQFIGSPDDSAEKTKLSCENCKGLLKQQWRFCPDCGTCLHQICVNCNSALDPTFKICPYCETPVRGATRANAKSIHHYETLFKGAFLDMVLTREEQEMLEIKRLELGLTPEEAEEIHRRCTPPKIREYEQLLEAAYADGIVNDAERLLLDRKAGQLKISAKIARAIECEIRASRPT